MSREGKSREAEAAFLRLLGRRVRLADALDVSLVELLDLGSSEADRVEGLPS